MTALELRTCVGWRRPPHPAPAGIVVATSGGGARLCRPCWLAWIREDTR